MKGGKNLRKKLLETQKGKCFICEEPTNLNIHPVQIDHIILLKIDGKDAPSNFALTHTTADNLVYSTRIVYPNFSFAETSYMLEAR